MSDPHPSKTDIEVLAADPNTKPIGFVVREYMGTPVFLYPGENFKEEDLVPIKTREGLKPGDVILIPGLMGGYYKMTVKGSEKGLSAQGERCIGFLEFGKDDRNAWICGGLVNPRGISRLRVSSSGQD